MELTARYRDIKDPQPERNEDPQAIVEQVRRKLEEG